MDERTTAPCDRTVVAEGWCHDPAAPAEGDCRVAATRDDETERDWDEEEEEETEANRRLM